MSRPCLALCIGLLLCATAAADTTTTAAPQVDQEREAYLKDRLFNHMKFAFLHGRHQSILNWTDVRFEAMGLPVPDAIYETDLVTTDLSQYDVLLAGGGGGFRMDDENIEALRQYVQAGGGYVGICGGAHSANKYGLIEADRYSLSGVRGSVRCILAQHPITEGYDISQKLWMSHASGGLFVIKEGSDEVPVVLFDLLRDTDLPTLVNVIARQYGEGRVVVFSSHPEGPAETHRILRNAMMWAAKVIGDEDEADPQ